MAVPLDAGRARPPRIAALQVFQNSPYRRLWTASLLWNFTRWMETTVVGWQVLEMTDSPFMVALAGFFRMAPMFFFGIFSGLLADRVPRKRVVLASQSISLVSAAVMAALLITDQIRLWHIALLVLATGFAWAMDFPSRRSLIMDLLGPQRLTSAMSLEIAALNLSKMVGPMVGGALIPLIGVAGCFVLLWAVHLTGLWMLSSVAQPPRSHSVGSGSVLKNIRDGLRYARTNQPILGVLVVTVLMNFFAFPYMQLMPVFARDVLKVGPALMGILMSADGLGAMVGVLFTAARSKIERRGLAFLGGSLGLLGALLLFSFSPWFSLAFLFLFLGGAFSIGFSVMQSAIILASASEEMRGRSMGLLTLAIGFGPLGTLHLGMLASLLGAPLALAISASAGIVLIGLLVPKVPGLRRA